MADIKNTQVMNVKPQVNINVLNAQEKVECPSEIHKQTNQRTYCIYENKPHIGTIEKK
jgi:D-hexose-6-phosphate mutarotase